MGTHGHGLRSKIVAASSCIPAAAEDLAPVTPLDPELEGNLLRTVTNQPEGLFSIRPPAKKFKVFSGESIVAACYDDMFSLSDLSDLSEPEDLVSTLSSQSQHPTKKQTRRRHRSNAGKANQIRIGRERQARKHIETAQMRTNTIQLKRFGLEQAMERPIVRDRSQVVHEESLAVVLDGDSPQRVVSADGYDIIYRIPGACRGKALAYVSDLCNKWGHLAKIKSSVANDRKGGYNTSAGGLVGTTRLCTLWHAIGHKCDDPTPAADILHSGKTFRAAIDAIAGLDMVSAYVMAALQRIDPTQHSLLEELWLKTCEKEKVQKMFNTINGGLAYEGREVVFNRWSGIHQDEQDPHWSWANILYFGTFERARLRFPSIQVTVMLYPGDMVFFRGRDLPHDAPDWGKGSRNFLVHFTHQHMWEYMGLTCASQKAVNFDP